MLPMPAPSRQTGVSDGPLYFLSARRIPRLRARVTFGRSGPTTFFSMPPAAIFLSTAKEIWKRTPPKTNGFWISLFRLQLHHKKVPQRIACTSIPAAAPTCRRIAPHPTAAEQCCGRFSTLRCTMILNFPRPSGPHIHLPPAAASARFDNRPNGRPAHPPRRMRERQR